MDLHDRLAKQLDALSGDRTEKVTVRLTVAERQELEKRCGSIQLSTYIRAGLFDYPVPRPRRPVPEVNRRLYVELNRIGVNLNQQTKCMNALPPEKLNGTIEDYLGTLSELKQQIQQIKACLLMGIESEDCEGAEEGRD